MFFKAKKENYWTIKNSILSNLEKGKFNESLASYYKLQEEFNILENKDSKQQEFDEISNFLILYMNALDLLRHCMMLEIDELEEKLERLNKLKQETQNISLKLNNFVENVYEKASKVCRFKHAEQDFNDKLSEIEHLVGDGSFDFALQRYKELQVIKSNMDYFSDKKDPLLDRKIEQLKRFLQVGYLRLRAYSPVANNRRRIKEKKLPELRRLPELPEPNSSIKHPHSFDPKVNRISKLIKQGYLDKAEELMKDVL